jgi:hypothetical protein
MATLQEIDNITINGNNYDRTQVVIEISGAAIVTTDLTTVVQGIDYQETPSIEFGYSLGSRRPTAVGFGNIEADGTLTLTDAGLAKLNDVAVESGLPSMHFLGQTGQVDLTITYITYAGGVKTDILEHVYFTNYNNGVNTDDVLYTREVSMVIGKVNIGGIE